MTAWSCAGCAKKAMPAEDSEPVLPSEWGWLQVGDDVFCVECAIPIWDAADQVKRTGELIQRGR